MQLHGAQIEEQIERRQVEQQLEPNRQSEQREVDIVSILPVDHVNAEREQAGGGEQRQYDHAVNMLADKLHLQLV
ncbi:hypothetical protein D3C85_1783300 [compost metagenome]